MPASSREIDPTSSSTRRPGPTSTAAPATRSSPCAGTGLRSESSPRPACAAGVDLVLVSTNEVFDGQRTDGRGYGPGDPPRPVNPYGASKLAGEIAARAAFARRWRRLEAGPGTPLAARPQLAIVRTAWLFGPPGNDFPAKILAAADRARAAGEPLRVVGDEVGSPTYAHRPRRGDRGAPRRRVLTRASTTSSTAARLPRGMGARASSPPSASTSRSRRSRSAGWPRASAAPPGPSWRRRRCRRASRCDHGRRRSPTTSRHCWRNGPRRPRARPLTDAGRASGMPLADRHRSRTSPAGASSATPTRGGASASSGGQARSGRSTRRRPGWPGAGVRPGEPLDVGAGGPARPPLPPSPARLLGRRRRPGVRRPRRRPAARRRHAVRRRSSRPASSAPDEWMRIPAGVAHGFLALEPLELLYLVTNEFDGSDELGFAWDDPAVAVPWPRARGDARRPPDPLRARSDEPDTPGARRPPSR